MGNKWSPGCTCCAEGYVDIIAGGSRWRLTAAGETKLFDAEVVDDGENVSGCNYAPSFNGSCVLAVSSLGEFHEMDVSDGSDFGALASGTSLRYVWRECNGIVLVGQHEPNDEFYTLETDGTTTVRTALGGGVDAAEKPGAWHGGDQLWRRAQVAIPETFRNTTSSTDVVDFAVVFGAGIACNQVRNIIGDNGDDFWALLINSARTLFTLCTVTRGGGGSQFGTPNFLDHPDATDVSGRASDVFCKLGDCLYTVSNTQVWRYDLSSGAGPTKILQRSSGTWGVGGIEAPGNCFVVEDGV